MSDAIIIQKRRREGLPEAVAVALGTREETAESKDSY